MPIIKRSQRYVTESKGQLLVRTPKECVTWPQSFRYRIVRDYLAPKTMCNAEHLAGLYDPSTVYTVQGKHLMFAQPRIPAPNMPTSTIVLRSEVINLDSKRKMELVHDDALMRVLMVYMFINEKVHSGVAAYKVSDWTPP